jgi:hypothetical protein
MSIARHPVLSKATHASRLPASWMTLYELTKVADTILLDGIKSGAVAPDMGRKDVRRLLPDDVVPAADEQPRDPLDVCVNAVDEALLAYLVTNPSPESRRVFCDWVIDRLQGVRLA